MKKILVLLSLAVLLLAACSSEPETIEVTRIVEVTRITEVTRIVEVTPTALPGGVFGSPECDSYKESIDDLFVRWVDAIDVAFSTSRANLSDRVVDLQAIRRETSSLDEPDCAAPLFVQAKMVNMMDDGVDLFTEFMAQNDISVKTASYAVTRDLVNDAVNSLRNEESETPRRIHYWAFGETEFSLDYIDESGIFQTADPGGFSGRFGFDKQPVVISVFLPESERAAVRLYNPAKGNGKLTCAILVNGEEVVLESATIQAMCELE